MIRSSPIRNYSIKIKRGGCFIQCSEKKHRESSKRKNLKIMSSPQKQQQQHNTLKIILNEIETSNLPDKNFKIMVIKMLTEVRKQMH